MSAPQHYEVRSFEFRGYTQVEIGAGPLPPERIVPPAGEEHAFEVPRWRRRVTVSISPTGRSVRVWVDGEEVR